MGSSPVADIGDWQTNSSVEISMIPMFGEVYSPVVMRTMI